MKASEIRELRDVELVDKLGDLQKQLFELRSQAVTEKLENNMAVKNIKRDIARVKTVIRAKKLVGQTDG
jgi:large subunit ribosomal protein L29